MKRLSPELKAKVGIEINRLLKSYNIDATITKNGNSGFANHYETGGQPIIKIPRIRNIDTCGVSFHEIGHIVLGHCEMLNGRVADKRPSYIHEYETMQYAINKLKELGVPHKLYELREIRYELENIAQAVNRRHPIEKVPKEIIKWTRLKLKDWKRAHKVFVYRTKIKKYSDIAIQFYDKNGCIFNGSM